MIAALERETKKQHLSGGGWEEQQWNSLSLYGRVEIKGSQAEPRNRLLREKIVKRAQSDALYDKYLQSVSNERTEGSQLSWNLEYTIS